MKMKFLILLLAFSTVLFAQTLEEWTQQKQIKIKRLLEQIYANKAYIETAKKGYTIVTSGLHTIRDIKRGEFNLHLAHFDSLTKVNFRIKKWVKVGDIIALQIRIFNVRKYTLDQARDSKQFTPDELVYCSIVFDDLLMECGKNIETLMLVITSGPLTMSDDERIRRIEKLYQDMQEKSSFTTSFSNEISVLALQRLTEFTEIDYSKRINQ